MSPSYTLLKEPYPHGVLGLIALQTDETVENELRQIFVDPKTALYVSRVPSAQVLTPQSIAQMGRDLPQSARLLPSLDRYHGVGYGCTSGTTLIGPEAVAEMVRAHCAAEQVTNPLSAGIAALKAVGARRIGLVSPYSADIAQPVRAAFEEAGFVVDRAVSFGEADERNVSRIDPNSLAAAAKEVRGAQTDAVFLSCTNLRTLGLIDRLEEALACPVISSNLALAWHLAQGLPPSAKIAGRGRLFDVTQPDGF